MCVPKSPDFQPRLASPDVGFTLCLRSSGVTAVVLADAAARRAWYYSKDESGRRLLAPPMDAFRGCWGLPQSLNAVPRLEQRAKEPRRPVLGAPWSLACARRVEPGAWPGVAAARVTSSPSRSPGSVFFDGQQATSCQEACASSLLDDFAGLTRVLDGALRTRIDLERGNGNSPPRAVDIGQAAGPRRPVPAWLI